MKGWGVLLMVVVLAAVPACAAAKPGSGHLRTSEHATIRFPGSNGYRIEVEASAGREALVSVTAEKGPARVQYLLFGFLGAGGSLDVHLPRVGRIAVKFDPTKVTRERRPEDCKGHPSIVASGYFRGSIELHGERGYTTVSRKSARGRLVRSFRGPCGKLGSGSTRQASREDAEEKKEGTTLGAARGMDPSASLRE